MLRIAALALVLVGVPGVAASPAGDPLAPAREGLVTCDNPDKTLSDCDGIVTYQFEPDGAIFAAATMALSIDPLVTITYRGPVTVRDGDVCGIMTLDLLSAAKVQVNGADQTGEKVEKLKALFTDGMTQMFPQLLGKEVCTRYVGSGKVLVAEAWFEGKELPELRSNEAWVQPDSVKLRAIAE